MSLSFACVSLAAHAQTPFETEKLFSKDAWDVELTHDSSDGQLWCTAFTRNRQNQALHLTAYDNGSLALFVFDERWNIANRNLRFFIDIDYDRWILDGEGEGIHVTVGMSDPEQAATFLRQLMEGSALAVFNGDERRLGTFSLSGSYAAISKLFDCWGKISPSGGAGSTDPFVTRSDPF
ncbi:hypothetical protein [Roseivivax marinus]|uniref:hypothetical protein n=1 Tax=Roseivivax marinus TaxID=1379903 RepID=UPI00273F1EA2|nr:hypothetical protein [Roseivivax marinus]